VVKVGTGAICDQTGRPDRKAIGKLAGQLAELRAGGVEVTLVASGAIGAGLGEMDISRRPRSVPQLQALAAIGQGQLMRTFHDIFARRGMVVAQVLVTRDAFEDRTRYLNIRNTLGALAEHHAMPIINENDTVAVDEIRFGENDILAAHVTNLLSAELLVLLTNVDGLLAGDKVVDTVEQVDIGTMKLVQTSRSAMGTGGMASKLAAAELVTRAGEAVVIANAKTHRILPRLLAGETLGTVFVPAKRKLTSRQRWIGQTAKPAGSITVDPGAATALKKRGKSLLPSGIRCLSGKFTKGDTVAIVDETGREIARGLSNYSAEQLQKIKGLKTSQIAKTLGDKPYDAVVHRNNMTLLNR
jgi:glutamate 5-kinase